MPPAQILLVSPDTSLEIRVASWLESRPDYALVDAARSLRQACELTHYHRANALLVDVAAPDSESEENWSALKFCYPDARIIVLLEADTGQKSLRLAATAGALAFLNKGEESLLSYLEDALRGTPYIPDVHFFERLWPAEEEAEGRELAELKPEHLTPRERLILHLIAEGLTNQQIAERLRLREKTVKNRVSEILNKIGLQNRTQLAIWALKHGLGGKQ